MNATRHWLAKSLSDGSAPRGTWAAADWAIRFYMRHGFALASPAQKSVLLKTYWSIPDRQIETSVVLANPPIDEM